MGKNRRSRKAALAGFLGGTLEYYDFFIYTTAASLVFNHVFFAPGDPTVALIQSFAIFGVGYVFRPLGAVLFGHLGDRYGRRNTLVMTLALMGGATFLIGCLPTYQQIGWWAPALLTLMRVLQGLSAGGETAGAASLTLEESPIGRRAFYPSFTASGINAGIVLASLAFIPVAAMEQESREAWGWRIPFLASIVVLFVAYMVRRTLDESQEFQKIQKTKPTKQKSRAPFWTMLKTHPIPFLVVSLMSVQIIVNTYMQSFGLAFGAQIGTVEASTMLWASVAGNVVAILSQPLWALLADKIGRKKVFIPGQILSAVMVYFFFHAVSVNNVPMIFLTTCLITGGSYAATNGIYTSWFAEQFNGKVRYTGLAVSLQVGILIAGFSPALGTALVDGDITKWGIAATVVSVGIGIVLIGAIFARETYQTPLDQLGNHLPEPQDH
ncbi:MAG TPA: MHS family MFS transporter [Enteractinococcus helveticum]|uniref:MHS family MFS transporter n=1 Tax=Enteractinococcus helveticum TaxID=1837282 RepID=A0A921K6I4_9MICC|nr:MFS transporter [Enteractinococcus helveticum]HJF13462.1 MHS family MFS transporter [Enteractinococcus helveticum]